MRPIRSADELTEWLDSACLDGAVRFELWQKPLGMDVRKLDAFEEGADTWTVADTVMARASRSGDGRATYQVRSFGAASDKPLNRTFVASEAAAEAMTVGAPHHDLSIGQAPMAAAVMGMLSSVTSGTLQTLQRENEQQRRTNESLTRASTAGFDIFVKSYERCLADMQSRLEVAQTEAAALRAQVNGFDDVRRAYEAKLSAMTEALSDEKENRDLRATRTALVVDQLKMFGPILATKFMKAPVAHPVVLARFFDSLKPEQLAAMHQVLTQEQMVLLMAIANEVKAAASGEATPTVPAHEPAPQSAASSAPPSAEASVPGGESAGPEPTPEGIARTLFTNASSEDVAAFMAEAHRIIDERATEEAAKAPSNDVVAPPAPGPVA